jgi:hypothetical protein
MRSIPGCVVRFVACRRAVTWAGEYRLGETPAFQPAPGGVEKGCTSDLIRITEDAEREGGIVVLIASHVISHRDGGE